MCNLSDYRSAYLMINSNTTKMNFKYCSQLPEPLHIIFCYVFLHFSHTSGSGNELIHVPINLFKNSY